MKNQVLLAKCLYASFISVYTINKLFKVRTWIWLYLEDKQIFPYTLCCWHYFFVRMRCIWYVMVSSFIHFDFSRKTISSDSDEYLRAISHKCLWCFSFSFYKEFLCFLYSTFLISKQNLLLFTALGFISIHFPCNSFHF